MVVRAALKVNNEKPTTLFTLTSGPCLTGHPPLFQANFANGLTSLFSAVSLLGNLYLYGRVADTESTLNLAADIQADLEDEVNDFRADVGDMHNVKAGVVAAKAEADALADRLARLTGVLNPTCEIVSEAGEIVLKSASINNNRDNTNSVIKVFEDHEGCVVA